jgi:hypothetical protein
MASSMSAWLLNVIWEGAIPFDVLQSLRKALANFEGSDWGKTIHSRLDVYQEIEDRLAKELTLVEQEKKNYQPRTRTAITNILLVQSEKHTLNLG